MPGLPASNSTRVATMSEATNAAQAARWNGESGQHWIAHRERHVAGHQRLVAHLFRAAGISRGERVLDIGCGCGETTILAARATQGSVLGLDISGPMLAVARRLAAEAGLANVAFAQGDAQVHPLQRDFYDVVISSFGTIFFDDPAAAFANIVAALRHGGRLTFLCWQDDMVNEIFAIPIRALQAHAGPQKLTDDDPFADPRWVADLLTAAGCADIRVEAVEELAWMGTGVADVMAYIGGMRRIRAVMAEIGDTARTERALASMAGEFAARQRPDGVWAGAAAWLVTTHRG